MSPFPLTTLDLLVAVAEPTRLRILNCLGAAPLFVSDLQALLDLPQPTVSRHLKVLREYGLVRYTDMGQFVLYRIGRLPAPLERLLRQVLETALKETAYRRERHAAMVRGRQSASLRTALEGS